MVIINPALKEASKKDLIVKNPAQFIDPLKKGPDLNVTK